MSIMKCRASNRSDDKLMINCTPQDRETRSANSKLKVRELMIMRGHNRDSNHTSSPPSRQREILIDSLGNKNITPICAKMIKPQENFSSSSQESDSDLHHSNKSPPKQSQAEYKRFANSLTCSNNHRNTNPSHSHQPMQQPTRRLMMMKQMPAYLRSLLHLQPQSSKATTATLRSRASTPSRTLLLALLLVLATSLATVVVHVESLQQSSSGTQSESTPMQASDGKLAAQVAHLLERSDSSSSSASGSSSSSSSGKDLSSPGNSESSSSQKSIVASLSSAVASAAAAAAVAAAQNSLSGGDGRSIMSSSSSGAQSKTGLAGSGNSRSGQSHQSRSSGLNHLAVKLADAIPEVPYNILHNMKKLDHAAPFYNVAKIQGANKESVNGGAGSLLASAISTAASAAAGSAGASPASGIEQLSALFKSPLWKRIADGYGEFTSEFRSLFRGPQPVHPMKGSTSPTTKLLRDISVPALLMLLATTFPSEWRPGRTRRKSSTALNGVSDLTQSAASSLELLPNFPVSPRFQELVGGSGHQQQQSSSQLPLNRQFMFPQAQARLTPPNSNGEYNLQDASLQSASQPQPLYYRHPLETQSMSPDQQQYQQPLHQVHSTAIRRSGETRDSDASSNKLQFQPRQVEAVKPVNSNGIQPATSGDSFSSLTSAAASNPTSGRYHQMAGKLLMSKLMNANGAFDGDDLGGAKVISARKDGQLLLLGDKHRYSLVNSDTDESSSSSSRAPQKAHLLASVSQAINSMLSARKLQSATPESGYQTTINHEVSSSSAPVMMRRQQYVGSVPAGGGAEQRDLSLLLPQSWKDVMKRTMSNVQQQASSQWKSIEGQLTNWVQDKLKSFPTPQSSSSILASPSSASSPTSAGGNSAAAPVSNLIATVSSTAMNILGLGSKGSSVATSTNSHHHSTPSASSSSAAAASSAPVSAGSESSSDPAQRGGKQDTPSSPKRSSQSAAASAGATLVGVADMIVNTLTNRHAASTSSSAAAHPPSSSSPKAVTAAISASPSPSTQQINSVAPSYPTMSGSETASSWQSVAASPSSDGSSSSAGASS